VKIADWQGIASGKLVMDAASVYWANDCTNGIWRISKSGGAPTQVVRDYTVRHVVVDATQIFWAVYDQGLVMKKNK
jgi:hypothetical protein